MITLFLLNAITENLWKWNFETLCLQVVFTQKPVVFFLLFIYIQGFNSCPMFTYVMQSFGLCTLNFLLCPGAYEWYREVQHGWSAMYLIYPSDQLLARNISSLLCFFFVRQFCMRWNSGAASTPTGISLLSYVFSLFDNFVWEMKFRCCINTDRNISSLLCFFFVWQN